jgi:hypothetical protein
LQITRRRTWWRPFRVLPPIVAVGVALAGGCAETFKNIAASPAVSQSQVDQLFSAIATRFDDVEIGPRYDFSRVKLGQSALVPSRIFDDTLVWESRPTPNVRLLAVSGEATGGHYRVERQRTLSAATRVGDSRHTIALERLAPDAYRWETNVDLAVGTITSEGVAAMGSALFRSPDGRTDRELRDDYAAAFPRTSAAFGRGFAIDSLRVLPGGLGTTNVSLSLGFHPETMRPAFPAFASYLDKYLGPAKYHVLVTDPAGSPLLEIAGRDRMMNVRYRLQRGKLVSLLGNPRPWPDSLRLNVDVSLKVKLFKVGFHQLTTDFAIVNSPHESSWTVTARHEPEWDLPLITERLIRSPLRRPFEGAGSMFSVSVRDSSGTQTLFTRRGRLDVQESTIMRFIGSLGSHMMGDLDKRVEADEDRFIRDGFRALQADLRVVGGQWRAETENVDRHQADRR